MQRYGGHRKLILRDALTSKSDYKLMQFTLLRLVEESESPTVKRFTFGPHGVPPPMRGSIGPGRIVNNAIRPVGDIDIMTL